MKPATFHDLFFTQAMNQQFNAAVNDDSAEPPLRRWLRATHQL